VRVDRPFLEIQYISGVSNFSRYLVNRDSARGALYKLNKANSPVIK
jgi:hypothetical protein